MPIYEYQCEKCKKSFERFQRISDKPLENCPDCDGAIKRLISQTSFSLKGGGWYKDGYSSAKKDVGKTSTTKSKQKNEKKANTPKVENKKTGNAK